MANTETDRLQLVEIVPIKGILGIFGRTISVADGFSIEVFRGEQHLDSIFSKDIALASDVNKRVEKLGVRPDDTLYRVNLGAKLLTLSGMFGTADGFEPGYKVELEIGVVNPGQFIMRYRQHDDPVRICQVALEGELRNYAALRTHDRLRRDELSYRVEHTLNVGNNKAIGMGVICVHDVDISMDSHRQKLRDVARAGEIDQLETQEKLKSEFFKSQFSHDERLRDANTDLAIQARKLEEQLRLEDLSQKAKMYSQVQITQFDNKLEAGVSQQEILADHPELQRIFAVSPPQNAGELASPNRSNYGDGHDNAAFTGDNILYGEAESDASSPKGTTRQRLEAFAVANQSFTVVPVTLDRLQQQLAGQNGSGAFLVCRVDQSGIAGARLFVGDIVINVNGENVSDIQVLADALHGRNRAGQLSLQVLRGGQPVNILINSLE